MKLTLYDILSLSMVLSLEVATMHDRKSSIFMCLKPILNQKAFVNWGLIMTDDFSKRTKTTSYFIL